MTWILDFLRWKFPLREVEEIEKSIHGAVAHRKSRPNWEMGKLTFKGPIFSAYQTVPADTYSALGILPGFQNYLPIFNFFPSSFFLPLRMSI